MDVTATNSVVGSSAGPLTRAMACKQQAAAAAAAAASAVIITNNNNNSQQQQQQSGGKISKTTATNNKSKKKRFTLSHYMTKKSACFHCRHLGGGCRVCGPAVAGPKYTRHLMRSVHPLIPKAPFSRLAREIAGEIKAVAPVSGKAVEALQEAAEGHVIKHLQLAETLANHAKRKTVMPADMKLAAQLLGGGNDGIGIAPFTPQD